MTYNTQSIIKPYLDDLTGKFANSKDVRYQFINWSGVYHLHMIAILKNGEEIRATVEGDYKKIKAIYDLNKASCVYAVMSEIRILGDGTKDYSACHYKTSGSSVANDFKFRLEE